MYREHYHFGSPSLVILHHQSIYNPYISYILYCIYLNNLLLFLRLTVDPEGKLWFSNVTLSDTSDDFLYACSAASYFRNEYKIGMLKLFYVFTKFLQ